ncbi:MAG: phage terminase large subunit, partial [Bacillota bacterium]|nr:phage terminase large subunit [Bacillota bacterium]
MRPTLNPVLRDFWAKPARNRILYGGRDSSKSWDAAGNAIALAQYTKVRTMATRQFQNRIDDSVYSLLKIQIERFGLKNRFAIYNNRIECPETGSDFLFYGRARNIDEIKGTEGVDIHWAEECHL